MTDKMLDKIPGFKAYFELWIGQHCATRRGYYYHYPYEITRTKSAPDWQTMMGVSGDGPWIYSNYYFDIGLYRPILIGENFISAGLSVRDAYGSPLSAMQMVKFWIAPNAVLAKDDTISSVDELSYGAWMPKDSPARASQEEIQPAVLVSYIRPYA